MIPLTDTQIYLTRMLNEYAERWLSYREVARYNQQHGVAKVTACLQAMRASTVGLYDRQIRNPAGYLAVMLRG